MKIDTGIAAVLLLCTSSIAAAQSWNRTGTGIVVHPKHGPEKAVRVEVYGNGIFRVTSGPTAKLDPGKSLMVTAQPLSRVFEIIEAPGSVMISTPKASALVDVASGDVSFRNPSGDVVLAESGPPAFAAATAEGEEFL